MRRCDDLGREEWKWNRDEVWITRFYEERMQKVMCTLISQLCEGLILFSRGFPIRILG